MYEDFLGDGDSVTFKRVREAQPYAEHNIEVKKKECVGHVGKRMGGRLRALLKKKLKDLEAGENLQGKKWTSLAVIMERQSGTIKKIH